MSLTKKKPLIVSIAVVTAAMMITGAAALKNRANAIAQPEVATKQLPRVSGVIPIEIRDAKASFPQENEMQDFNCIVKNNTDKEITSVVLLYKITTVNSSGQEVTDTFVLFRESYVHADVREAHHYRPLVPGEEYLFQSSGVTAFENARIKRVEASIDYAEFEDKNKLGPDVKGSQIITQLREGAAQYKTWLGQKFKQMRSSVDAILPLLKERDLPKEIGLKSSHAEGGARVYRGHMLRVFESHGAHEAKKYLSR